MCIWDVTSRIWVLGNASKRYLLAAEILVAADVSAHEERRSSTVFTWWNWLVRVELAVVQQRYHAPGHFNHD
ncbi:MAG: hypothetical protein ACRDSH_00140 [Pseudonocardiaceae bacterium]